MALGIERDTIGDIIVIGWHSVVIVCVPEMSGYITENLSKIGRVGIKTSEISLDGIPVIQDDFVVKKARPHYLLIMY